MNWKDLFIGLFIGWVTMFILLVSIGTYLNDHPEFLR